jgi:hypothetical protein
MATDASSPQVVSDNLVMNRGVWQLECASLVVLVVLMKLLANNFLYAICLLYRRRRYLYFINILPPLFGLVACAISLLVEIFPWAIGCNAVGYVDATALTIGTPAMASILLAKAYTGSNRTVWLKCMGNLAIVGSIAVGIACYFSLSLTRTPDGRCPSVLSISWIAAKWASDLFTNSLLAAGFAHALWYRNDGCQKQRQSLQRVLIRNGLLYAILAVVSNVCATGLVISSNGTREWQLHIYAMDCK